MTLVKGLLARQLALIASQGFKPLRRHLLGMAVLSCALFSAGQAGAVQLIAHESVPVAQVSVLELRAIYTMRLNRWGDGQEVRAFVLPRQNETHNSFCKNFLQALPRQMEVFWHRLVYSGMGRAPVVVQSEQEMIERIRQTPGAIGYVESVNEVSGENIRVVALQP